MKEWGIALTLFLTSTQPAYAAFSFSLGSLSSQSISSTTQEVSITLLLNELPSPSYFRAAFQKESGDDYFGEIKNNSGIWTKVAPFGSPCQDYLYISDTSATSASILLRVGEGTLPQSGAYHIKAHRFTSSACSSTQATNELAMALDLPPPPPSLIPTSSPTSTPKPSSMPKPSPIRTTPTSIVLAQTSVEPTLYTPILGITDYPIPSDILGISSEDSPIPTAPLVQVAQVSPSQPPWPSMILISLGSAGLVGSLISLFLRRP